MTKTISPLYIPAELKSVNKIFNFKSFAIYIYATIYIIAKGIIAGIKTKVIKTFLL